MRFNKFCYIVKKIYNKLPEDIKSQIEIQIQKTPQRR